MVRYRVGNGSNVRKSKTEVVQDAMCVGFMMRVHMINRRWIKVWRDENIRKSYSEHLVKSAG